MARKLWLDTNVIIRIITGDPQEMAQEAEDMILKVEMGELVLRLSAIVVAECCWVLESFYEAQPTDISDTLLKFTNAIGVETEEKPVVQQALLDFPLKRLILWMLILRHMPKPTPRRMWLHGISIIIG